MGKKHILKWDIILNQKEEGKISTEKGTFIIENVGGGLVIRQEA